MIPVPKLRIGVNFGLHYNKLIFITVSGNFITSQNKQVIVNFKKSYILIQSLMFVLYRN
jgi:hypothetical protein